MLMLRAEIVVVIGGNEDALGVAVIEDGDGLCGREVRRVGVLYRRRPEDCLATSESDRSSECCDRGFRAWCGSQKGPQMPRRICACLDFEVVDFTTGNPAFS